jgi:hypothetical protein
MTTKVGKNLRNVYDTHADMVADTDLRVGEAVRTLGKNTLGDGLGTDFIVVAGGTGITGDGYVDLDNGLQAEGMNGKFTMGWDSGSGRNFLQVYNWVDEVQIIQFPDGTQSGDAHVSLLPPDVRRDSHAFLATAGTFGGENDIDFRTYLYSDYILLRGKSTYQNEQFQILIDTLPQRDDGRKKTTSVWNEYGDGGLLLAEHQYAFDAAMTIPSNRTTDPIKFAALPVLFEQYVEISKRSTGVLEFRMTPNTNDITLTDEASGTELGKIEADGITLGGKKVYAETVTDVQATNGSHEIKDTLALSTATTQTYRLTASGSICAGRLRVVAIGSGGAGYGVKEISFQSDGTTVATQTVVDTLLTEFTANVVLNSGVLDLEVYYAGGYGGSGKFQVSVDWDVRTA